MPVSKLLKLPYGSYLLIRLDYVIICGNELEAKIMRIIEMYMDDERRILYKELLNDPQNALDKDAEVDITRDVWAAISHRLFKNDLYDQDMSENTLKRALKSLLKKKFIRVRDTGLKRYEAPKYQINAEVVQDELNLLSKIGKTGYQKLMVSKIDGIKKPSHQKETPSDHQNLTVSGDSRVSKIDPNSRKVTDSVEDTEEESTLPRESQPATSGADAPTHALVSQDVVISGHDYQLPHLDVNCAQWRAMNQDKTCQDFQTAIDAARLAPARTITLAGLRPSQDEPYRPDFTASQERGALPIATTTQGATDEHIANTVDYSGDNRVGSTGGHVAVATAHTWAERGAEPSGQAAEITADLPQDTPAGDSRGYEKAGVQHTSAAPAVQVSAKAEPANPSRGRGSGKKAAEPVLEFTTEGRKVYESWCALFKSPPRTAEKTVECANDLYERLMPWCQSLHLPCKGLLKEIKDWLYKTDPDWYRRKGVTLCDIGAKFESWQSVKTDELEREAKPKTAPATSTRTVSGLKRWTPPTQMARA